MLFFVVRLSHYGEFKVEHAFPNKSFSRPSFNHLYVLPGACLRCANTTYFISVSVAVAGRFHPASKKKITLRECLYIFSSKVSLKNDPLSLNPYNIDKKNQVLKLLVVTAAVELVLSLDLSERKCSSIIFIVISNTISAAERHI